VAVVEGEESATVISRKKADIKALAGVSVNRYKFSNMCFYKGTAAEFIEAE